MIHCGLPLQIPDPGQIHIQITLAITHFVLKGPSLMKSSYDHEWLRQISWAIIKIESKLRTTLQTSESNPDLHLMNLTYYESDGDRMGNRLMEDIDWIIESRVGMKRGVGLTRSRLQALITESMDGYGGWMDGKADHPTTWNDLVHHHAQGYAFEATMADWSLMFREISSQFVYESAVMVNGGDKALEIAKVCMTPDNYIVKSQYWDELDGIDSPTHYLGTHPRRVRGRSSGFLHHYRNGIG